MLAPWIIKHFPPHRYYTESFGGAASCLLRKERCYSEIYNDLDGELVNLFRVARDHGQILQEQLKFTPFAREEYLLSYQPSDNPIEQARRTVIRSFMGFGSNAHNRKTGFRAKSNRSGTTPAHDWRNYPDAFEAIIDRLRGVVIENRPAIEVIKQHDDPQTLHYADPPYLASTRGKGEDYTHEMTEKGHQELSEVLHSCQGMVVISGYPSSLYNYLYSDWFVIERRALADGARKRVEALWINGEAMQKLHGIQKSIFVDTPQEIALCPST
jgi:DNA adenine methylase